MNAWWQLWEKHFTPEECQRILNDGLKLPAQTGSIGHGGQNTVVDDMRRSKVRWIPRYGQQWAWLTARLDHIIQQSNANAFGFDLTYNPDIQLTEYDSNVVGHYDWHEDNNWKRDRPFDRKLSLVVQLTDPATYEGGALELQEDMPTDGRFTSQGTVIVFPSFLKHRVTDTTSGVRHSLVTWVEGPKFR